MSPVTIHRVQTIYSLVGKNESDISPVWQILQVFLYASCIALGFVVCWLFTQIIDLVKEHCVLYANLVLTNKTFDIVHGKNVSCTANLLQPVLHASPCDIILMFAVLTTTIALFFLVMFVYCGRGGAGKPEMPDAWRIVWPAIIINLVCSSAVLYSASSYTFGLYSFKRNIQKQWGLNVTDFDMSEIKCLQLGDDVVGETLSTGLYVLKEFIYIWVSFWLLNLFWLVLRCIFNIDFQLVRTTTYEYTKEPMLVRRPVITYPAEDNKESVKKTKSVKFRPVFSNDIIKESSSKRKRKITEASTSTTGLSEL